MLYIAKSFIWKWFTCTFIFTHFYDYFAEIQNRSLVSEREFTRLVDRSVTPSLIHSLGRKLLFVFPLTNAQLDGDEEKNIVEWFGKCET